MSAIKDLVDLATQLDSSLKDSKMREAFLPLKEKVVQIQMADLQSEREHLAEIERLKVTHSHEVDSLKADNLTLTQQLHARTERDRLRQGLKLDAPSNTYFDEISGVHYCLPCLESSSPQKLPIQDLNGYFLCHVCKTTFIDTSRLKQDAGGVLRDGSGKPHCHYCGRPLTTVHSNALKCPEHGVFRPTREDERPAT